MGEDTLLRVGADEPGAIRRAAEAVSAGQVVAFPTDTAYGVGVRPDSAEAVDAVYALKGRPRSLPLILLAAAAEDLAGWAELPEAAGPLIARWWPGPLTLVVPAGPRTPGFVRAADCTVGVRIPAHPAARRLLEATGPLATTSANRSGGPSPRSADDVTAAFEGAARGPGEGAARGPGEGAARGSGEGAARGSGEGDAGGGGAGAAGGSGEGAPAVLLDGGPTVHGADSTVLALGPAPRILRLGAVSREDLANLLPGI